MRTVAVVGGGISGLLSAFFLEKKGYKVTLFEKEKNFGGKLQTTKSPYGITESAANGILCDALVEEIFSEIGITPLSTLKASRARYILKKGKPRKWPLGFFQSLGLLLFFIKKPWLTAKNIENTTLARWLEQYVSKDAVEYLITPACQGIFGKGADELSASLVMNYFFNKKKVAKGKLKGTVSSQNGMGEIVQKLTDYLKQKNIIFETRDLQNLNDILISFNEIVVATDIQSAAHLLESIRDLRGQNLKAIPMVDLASINIFVQESKSPYPGFGILFPRKEGIQALGVLQNSYIFENRSENDLSETWIYQLPPNATDEDLLNNLKKDRETVFNTSSKILYSKINRWPQALPLYGKELEQFLKNTPPGHPRVHLMGNYLGEIGLNRLFHQAQSLASSLN